MTYRPDREHSALEIPLEMANERMAALRSEMRRSREADDGPPNGAVRRFRQGIGLRLIALGSALAAEHRTRPLAR